MKTINNTYLLFDDVRKNEEILEKNNSQLNRRNYLRSLISFYEYGLSFIRERTLDLIILKGEFTGNMNFLELIPLLDFSPNIDESGKLKGEIPNKFPFIPLVKYTLRTLSELIGYSNKIFSDNKWDHFIESMKIRNRITHPKLDTDIDISEEELIIIKSGWIWWNSEAQGILNAYYDFLKQPTSYGLSKVGKEIDIKN